MLLSLFRGSLHFRNTTCSDHLRNTGIDFTLPTINSEFGKKRFNFARAALWN